MLAKLIKLLTSKTAKIIGVCLLLAILMSSVTFYWLQNRNISQSEADKILTQVEQLDSKAKYKEAAAKLQSYLDHKKMSNDVRAQLTYALAGNYMMLREYSPALATILKAAQIRGSLDFVLAHSIADAAIAAGKKDTAVEYYQKAIDIAKSDGDPYDDQSIEGYKATIKYIQSGATRSNSIPAGVNIPKEFRQ